jgi:N-acyl-D-amino-acid deacylase
MNTFDLVVRNGIVVDGSGLPGLQADVGIVGDRIVHVGRIREKGRTEIDAEGHAVTPGFVDGHTHMDAQVFWDPYGTCSSWHGVTTVVMGNCGFTLAPCRDNARELVVRNVERAEDIPPAALAEGIEWSWESYTGYLDAVDRLPKAINYAGYVGHSALRTWAMGERAFEQDATADDLDDMAAELRRALKAGAIGFSTSRNPVHTTSDDRPVASRRSDWSEVVRLASVLAEFGGDRIFQLAVERAMADPDPTIRKAAFDRLKHLASYCGSPVTFGIIEEEDGHRWRGLLDVVDESNRLGGRAFGQSLPRAVTVLYSFKARLPYDRLSGWSEIRDLPVDAKRRILESAEGRERLVKSAIHGPYLVSGGTVGRAPDYERMNVLYDPVGPNPTVAELARQRGVHPVDVIIDEALVSNFDRFFSLRVGNHIEEDVLTILRHPRVVTTFSDSGAHVGYIMESSIQTYLLAYWVRQRQEFTFEEAVRMLTLEPATAWGFYDRGMVRPGFVADLNVIDPSSVAPSELTVDTDLPGSVSRLKQKAQGIKSTIVAGHVTLSEGENTGVMPGRLLRRQPILSS